MHFNNDSSVREWYDNETEILTEQGWKHFYELPGTEKVATLNQKTGETEWQKPTAKQTYDHNGGMYRIITNCINHQTYRYAIC